MSHNTLEKYLRVFQSHPLSFRELLKLSDSELYTIVPQPLESQSRHERLDDLFPEMSSELKRVGMTRYLLWERYLKENPEGVKYSRFYEHFNRYLSAQKLSYVFEHKAGGKLMVDFACKKLHLVDGETGELIPVEVFVGILTCSGYTFAKATTSTGEKTSSSAELPAVVSPSLLRHWAIRPVCRAERWPTSRFQSCCSNSSPTNLMVPSAKKWSALKR
jgi:hypothetical protein